MGNKNEVPVILIADDSEADRDMIIRVIQMNNINCITREVEDGEELLRYIQHEPPYQDLTQYPNPDFLFLDINMPKVNGKEALKQLRTTSSGKLLPVIMFTTSDQDKDVAEAYRLGANGYVKKPVELDQFLSAVASIKSFWFEVAILPDKNKKHEN